MPESIPLLDGLRKLETIISVQRENIKKLQGATEMEFMVDNLLDNQVQLSIAVETILVALQKILENSQKKAENSLDF